MPQTLPSYPSDESPLSEREAPQVHHMPVLLPPALRRRLRHVANIKSLRRRVATATLGFLALSTIGMALPTSAVDLHKALEVPTLPAQSLVVAAITAPEAAIRDGYSAILLPALQYPVGSTSTVASGYGPRECNGCSTFHNGLDIFPGEGTPVHAMAAGTVVATDTAGGTSMGVYVTLQHSMGGETVKSLYGHLQTGTMPFSVGDKVSVGQVVGLVGATGNAQGAHLHFEIWPGGGGSVDPYIWLAARLG